MSNRDWVCFDCRIAVRRVAGIKGEVPCSGCGKPFWCFGYKITVPPKSKIKEWAALKASYFQSLREHERDEAKEQVRIVHNLEQEIVRLESLPSNKGRSDAINLLRRQLSKFQNGNG